MSRQQDVLLIGDSLIKRVRLEEKANVLSFLGATVQDLMNFVKNFDRQNREMVSVKICNHKQ